MRFEDNLKTWNDERGFGFIEPTAGGQEIFVHIKSFPPGISRPEPRLKVTFQVEQSADGKKKATNVLLVRQPRPSSQAKAKRGTSWEKSSLFALFAFGLIFLVVTLVWRPPMLFALAYGVMSLVCFLLYAHDKNAAQTGDWRTPESTLLMVGILGGWPGAIIAQQMFRHKTSKFSFRVAFWMTVVLNVVVFIALATPLMRAGQA